MKKIFTKSKNLEIRIFSKKYINKKYISWLNNKKLMKFSRQVYFKHNYNSCVEYLKSMNRSKNLFLAIIEKSSSLGHVGNVSIYFDKLNKTADISIMIGEQKALGCGYEAWNAVLIKLLKMKSVNKVIAGTLKLNKKMIKIMKKSKMKKTGERKSVFLYNKKYHDFVFYQSRN